MADIETLQARIVVLEQALRPFALAFDEWDGIGAEHLTLRQAHEETPGEVDQNSVTVAHLKLASEVLK